MAEPRIAACPDCGAERDTRAQPRTRLRCPSCGGHYLAPPLSDPPPPADPQPEQLIEGVDLGPDVTRIETLSFPEAPIAPAAVTDDAGNGSPPVTTDELAEDSVAAPGEPATDTEPPAGSLTGGAAPPDEPAPSSTPPTLPEGPARRRGRRRYAGGRW